MEMEDLLAGSFVFLLADQYEDGLWGRSISFGEKAPHGTVEENRAINQRGQVKSLTVSYMAAKAIYAYTKNRRNPSIQRLSDCLSRHRDESGGYGTFSGPESMIEGRYRIISTPRHTASALLTLNLLERLRDESAQQSAIFLVEQSSPSGGWPFANPDVLSTIYVLSSLRLVGEKLNDLFTPSESRSINEIIQRGVEWLGKRSDSKTWTFTKDGPTLRDTAEVLCTFPALRLIDERLYIESLDNLVKLQNPDGGWPAWQNGASDLRATIWTVNAIAESGNRELESAVKTGLSFILLHMCEDAQVRDLSSEHWALLVNFSEHFGKMSGVPIPLSEENSLVIYAQGIQQNAFVNGDTSFLIKGHYRRYPFLKPAVLRVISLHPEIRKRNPAEKLVDWYDRKPRWIRALVTASIILLGLVVTFLALFR